MRSIINFLNVYRYSAEQRNQFAFNVFLGAAVLIFSIMVRNTAIVQGSINGWFDYYIMFRINSATDTQKAAQNITFLDFDNKSFQSLGKPAMTPRDKVAELLEIAYTGKARIVILDLDFSEPDYSPAKIFAGDEVAKTGLERDKILFDTIERIKKDPNAQTKILLPLVTYADKTIKPNIFVSLIDNEKVFAVTPTLTTNRVGDNYARFWLPYLEVQDENGERKILWSIPLLSSVLYGGNFSELEILKSKILNTDKDFFETTINHDTTPKKFKFYREQTKDGGLIRDTASLQYNRIQYVALPPDVFVQFPLGTINPANVGHWRKNGLDNKRIDCRDKIVVIGRTDEDCSDIFPTPCGNLSGMYIHGNGIASILGETRPHLTSIYKHVLIELLLILIAAYSFLGLSETKAKIVVVVMYVLCWILTYVYFCFTNEFVYLVFAFMSVGVYNFVNNIQTFFVGGFSIRRFFGRRLH